MDGVLCYYIVLIYNIQGVTTYFIYSDYNSFYFKKQTKLTSVRKENSLPNIKASLTLKLLFRVFFFCNI